MKKLNAILLTLPLACIFGVSNTHAQAISKQTIFYEYQVHIECHHNNIPDHESKDKIRVTMEDANGNAVWSGTANKDSVSGGNNPRCKWGQKARYTFPNPKRLPRQPKVTKVKLQTPGNDAFFVDYIELRQEKYKQVCETDTRLPAFKKCYGPTTSLNPPGLIKRWGAEEGKGWCLSKNPNQVNVSNWRRQVSGQCYESISFDRNESGGRGKVASNSKPASAGSATVYKGCNYTGYGINLPKGRYTLSQLRARGISNDDISSIRVSGGARVQAFQHNNFSGKSWNYTRNTSCFVSNGSNDEVSSIIVR